VKELAELLEKFLLIGFGISVVTLFIPLFDGIYINYQFQVKNQEQSEEDLQTFIENIQKFERDELKQEIVGFFVYNGDISIGISEDHSENMILIFRFSNSTFQTPQYYNIELKNRYRIEIESFTIKSYIILTQNSTNSIVFRD
jgi:hypothetical protein